MSIDDKVAKKTVYKIIKALKENNKKAHGQIYRLVECCGPQVAEELLKDALELEQQGGLMTLDGKRRRTIGGVFFHLAKLCVPRKYKQDIFYPRKKKTEDATEEKSSEEPK